MLNLGMIPPVEANHVRQLDKQVEVRWRYRFISISWETFVCSGRICVISSCTSLACWLSWYLLVKQRTKWGGGATSPKESASGWSPGYYKYCTWYNIHCGLSPSFVYFQNKYVFSVHRKGVMRWRTSCLVCLGISSLVNWFIDMSGYIDILSFKLLPD